ncbi:MAG: ribosome-associated translation inhibitor RaiA [Clostridium sp.]|uniref:ribosome hibernation-promoting factor, HPF/YfiA family n=1 Tax=Clostridium sp. TaxID=1506 RepID=UPI00304314DE
MKVRVIGKNIEITEGLRLAVEKKLSKIDKYFIDDIKATATLSVEKNMHKIEVTIPFNNALLRAEVKNDDMYSSIDFVIDKLESQVRKQKTRLEKRNHNNSLRFNNIQAYDNYTEEDEPRIVKTKRFAIKPMNEEEAVLQMELLAHDFFVFMNADTDEVNVVYKRKDGNYGLIEQDF